jgi:hypothetical protein
VVRPDALLGGPARLKPEDVEGFQVVHRSWVGEAGRHLCVGVPDDAMAPVLRRGFLVGVDCRPGLAEELVGQMVAAGVEGRLLIRYLADITETHWVLAPHDPSLRPLVIERRGVLPVLGKVTWWLGRPQAPGQI